MKLLVILISSVLILLPNISLANEIQQHRFIKLIDIKANIANKEILKQRHYLQKLYRLFMQHKKLNVTNKLWLNEMSKEYRLKPSQFNTSKNWTTLIKRIDIIPNSLAIAQAINESAWGTSRFAREGNSYFGEWCYKKGCGLVPLRRHPEKNYEVRRFPNILSSVKSYMHNLNSSILYRAFRTKRYQLRKANKKITGLSLVSTLDRYSIKRQVYVKIITAIIKDYQLSRYDN